jgi:hypothetical protein
MSSPADVSPCAITTAPAGPTSTCRKDASGLAPGKGTATHLDRLSRNRGDAAFDDVTLASGILKPGFSQGTAVEAINNNWLPELFVGNIGANWLFINHGSGTFLDTTEVAALHGFNGRRTTNCQIADLNEDGYPFCMKLVSGGERFLRGNLPAKRRHTPSICPLLLCGFSRPAPFDLGRWSVCRRDVPLRPRRPEPGNARFRDAVSGCRSRWPTRSACGERALRRFERSGDSVPHETAVLSSSRGGLCSGRREHPRPLVRGGLSWPRHGPHRLDSGRTGGCRGDAAARSGDSVDQPDRIGRAISGGPSTGRASSAGRHRNHSGSNDVPRPPIAAIDRRRRLPLEQPARADIRTD